jgi:hypothetical protein
MTSLVPAQLVLQSGSKRDHVVVLDCDCTGSAPVTQTGDSRLI